MLKGSPITTSHNAAADTSAAPASAPATFAALGVPAPIAKSLAAEGKTEAFPIQRDTLPDTLAGRDVLGRGKTGSGKTLAFSIPMIARLGASTDSGARRGRGNRTPSPRGLILAPTRELATQIENVVRPMAAAYGMKSTTIFGGVSANRQISALRSGVDIVVACPGRLEDLLQQRALTLDEVEVTVIDEADHMADLGFLPGVTRIMQKTPQDGQRLFFSATLDNGVDKLVKRFLHNEVLHSVDSPESHVSDMTHHVFQVHADLKNDLVKTLASGTGRRILFTRTKHRAKKLARQLTTQGIPSVDLHGDLSQPQRDRNLAAFGGGDVRVLVATDVAARGVHVDAIELVVHVDPPAEHKAYLHRSGRTARAGTSGDVVTVMLPDQARDTQVLLRKAKIKVSPASVTPESAEVADLVGDIAPFVEPAPKAPQQQQSRRRPQGAGSGGRGGSGRRSGGRGGSSRGTGGVASAGAGASSGGGQSRRGGSSSHSSQSARGAGQPSRGGQSSRGRSRSHSRIA